MTLPLAVSVSGTLAPRGVAYARARAATWGLPFLPRRHKAPLEVLWAQAEALLVFEPDGVMLRDRAGSYRFHTGVAQLRLLALEAGGPDRLVTAAELRPGDAVLDCTLGLAQDALVAARAVGEQGRVVGLEKSLALFAAVSEGLERAPARPRSCRVEARQEGFEAFLVAAPPASFDVVFFDPMFERPRKSQPSFELLRRFACSDPVTPETLVQACRVARRWVVVKGSRYSSDLRKLGLQPEPASRSATVVFGRIAATGP